MGEFEGKSGKKREIYYGMKYRLGKKEGWVKWRKEGRKERKKGKRSTLSMFELLSFSMGDLCFTTEPYFFRHFFNGKYILNFPQPGLTLSGELFW